MIWCYETVTVPNAPVGSSIRLIGVYNPPEDQGANPMIELKVEVAAGPDTTALILTMFTHNPSGLGYQKTPEVEDIRARYNSKIVKIINRLLAVDFHQLAALKRIS